MDQAGQENATITRTEQLAPDIFRITVRAPGIARASRPGQFVMVRVADAYDPLLRRPFSIHQVIAPDHVQILFRVVGKGTGILAEAAVGRELDLVGPLGRGFHITRQQLLCLVGGGMGIAPLLFLAKRLLQVPEKPEILVLVGAGTKAELLALAGDLERMGLEVRTATDDGSLGHHGLVGDLLAGLDSRVRRAYVCGPYPMMRAVAAQCRSLGWACEVSLETMMACGLAACLGCAIPRKEGEGYLHVCKHGPVFDAEEVAWR